MKKHFRIAALQCNFQTREQTLAMPEFWSSFGFNTEQLLHTHADMYSAVYEEKTHGELVTEYLQKSEASGIGTIVYMNCHILGPSIANRKEEWGVRDLNGDYPLSYGTYPACCLNSSWVDYFFDCVESLNKYNIMGFFFDGPPYHVCYCPRCQAKFEQIYNKKQTQASQAELDEFSYESALAFKDALYKKVKSVNPNWMMYFNEGIFSGRSDSKNMVRQLASDDIVGTEGGFFFYIPPKNHDMWFCASSAKIAEAAAGDKPTVIFQAGDHKSWGWFLHTPAETALCYISALGNGASVWYGIHCNPDNLLSPTGNMVKKLVQFDKQYDELYQNSSSKSDIAVFFSFDTSAHYYQSSVESDFYGSSGVTPDFQGDYRKASQGAFALCHHLNLAHDAITEINLQDLKRYKVVIIPNLAMVSDQTAEALLDYVAAGGTIIADSEFGMFDENGVKREQGIFEKAAGFSFTGKYLDHQTFNYCAFPGFYEADNAHKWLPAPTWSAEITVTDPANIFGKANQPMRGCYEDKPQDPTLPFAVKTAYGKGTIYYIAGSAFEHYYNFSIAAWREFFDKLIHCYGGNTFKLHNATTGVAMTVRQTQKDCALVHLTNYTSVTRPIDKSAVLHNLELVVPEEYTSAADIWSGKELKKVAPGKFIIDQLEEIAVIKLS